MDARYDVVIVRPYINFPNESAAVDRYWQLRRQLSVAGLSSALVCSDFHHNKKEKRAEGVAKFADVYLINSGSYERNISFSRVIFEVAFCIKALFILLKLKPRCVVIGEPLVGTLFLASILKVTGVPTVGDFIDLFPETYKFKIRSRLLFSAVSSPFWLARWFTARFLYAHAVSVSEDFRKSIGVSAERITTIYWGGNTVYGYPMGRCSRVGLIYAGSLGEGYDIELLIAYAEKNPHVPVVIAGDGPKSELCKKADLAGTIRFLGSVGPERLTEELSAAAVGVLPYKRGSAVSVPIKFFDYLSHGLVIVSSLNGEATRIAIDNNIGLAYVAGNLDSFSSAADLALRMTPDSTKVTELSKKMLAETQYSEFALLLRRISQP